MMPNEERELYRSGNGGRSTTGMESQRNRREHSHERPGCRYSLLGAEFPPLGDFSQSLIRDDGKVLVLHEPNAASGGRLSRLEVGDFLVRDAHGPQHAELLRLIGTLVGEAD